MPSPTRGLSQGPKTIHMFFRNCEQILAFSKWPLNLLGILNSTCFISGEITLPILQWPVSYVPKRGDSKLFPAFLFFLANNSWQCSFLLSLWRVTTSWTSCMELEQEFLTAGKWVLNSSLRLQTNLYEPCAYVRGLRAAGRRLSFPWGFNENNICR